MKAFKALPLLLFVCLVSFVVPNEETNEKQEYKHKDAAKLAKASLRDKFMEADDKVSYDRIRAHEEAKMKKFEGLVKEKRTKLDDHRAGREKLTDEDIYYFTRQVEGLQKKIDHINGMTEEEYEDWLLAKVRSFHDVNYMNVSEL